MRSANWSNGSPTPPATPRAVGTRVESAEPGYVVMYLAKTDHLLQANGFFHGGVIAGLADHAAGGAVTTAMPPAGSQ